MAGRPHRPMIDRLIEKLDVGLCWEFHGSSTVNGYGQIRGDYPDYRLFRAHRAMWMILVGPIPVGLDLDHLCRNRKCCNPDHLEPVTRKENVRRGARGPRIPRKRTLACIYGHPRTPENTIIRKNGRRLCLPCERARWNRNNAEKKRLRSIR